MGDTWLLCGSAQEFVSCVALDLRNAVRDVGWPSVSYQLPASLTQPQNYQGMEFVKCQPSGYYYYIMMGVTTA